MTAPQIAPIVVAISRNIPTRTFEYPSRTYAAAAPDDVAITETSAAPIAYLISTLKSSVSIGTITTPPPSPVSAPRNPARNDPAKISALNSAVFNAAPLRLAVGARAQRHTRHTREFPAPV